MSSISSISSTFIPLTTGTSTTPVSNTGTQGSTPLTFDVRQDVLGVPLAGGSLGLPTGGAPGDTEALLALVALKLRQTMGTMNNNAVATRMNQYAQMLQQAQSLIAAYVNASNVLTTSQMTYQTTQTALSKVQGKLQTLYAPLTGDGNQQNLQAVTPDASGGQGTYGQYLAALQDYQGKNKSYTDISTQVTQDQAAYNTALAKASTSDPSAYYQSVYMARQTQQQQLTTKQQQLAGMKPPQQLSASEQATLQTLNGTATTTGSVAEASAAYQSLTNNVATTNSTLQTDLGKQSTAFQNLVAAEKTLIPYLDSTGGSTFTDKYPQSGIAQSYTFDPQALQGVTVSQTGIISTTMNVITDLQNNKKALQQTLTDTQTAITNAAATLNQFSANDGSADPTQNQMLVLLNLTQSLTTALSQHTSDQSSSGNSNESNDDMLSNRFQRNDNNIDALNESQDIVSRIADLRRRIAAMFDNPAGQTAVQLASGLTSTLLALVGLLDQPPVVPSSSDLFQNASSPSQSSSPRMRIPV